MILSLQYNKEIVEIYCNLILLRFNNIKLEKNNIKIHEYKIEY